MAMALSLVTFFGMRKKSVPARTGHCPQCSTVDKKTTIFPHLPMRHFGVTAFCPICGLALQLLPTPLRSSAFKSGNASSRSCKSVFFHGLFSINCSDVSTCHVVFPFLHLYFHSCNVFSHLPSSSPKQWFGNVVQHTCSTFSAVQKLLHPSFMLFHPFCLFLFLLCSLTTLPSLLHTVHSLGSTILAYKSQRAVDRPSISSHGRCILRHSFPSQDTSCSSVF